MCIAQCAEVRAGQYLVLGVSAAPPPDDHHPDEHGHHERHPGEGDGHIHAPLLAHLHPPHGVGLQYIHL